VNKLDYVMKALDSYCHQATILTLNGGWYDLQLVKKHLFPAMVKKARTPRNEGRNDEQRWPSVILRNSQILCLTSHDLRFIDLASFLAPGTSLAKFVAMYTNGG